MPQPIISMIEAVHEVRNPGDIILGRYELEAREAFRHASDDQIGKSELNLLRQPHVTIQCTARVELHATATCQDVETKGHVQILSCRPERVILMRAIRLVFWGSPPDQ